MVRIHLCKYICARIQTLCNNYATNDVNFRQLLPSQGQPLQDSVLSMRYCCNTNDRIATNCFSSKTKLIYMAASNAGTGWQRCAPAKPYFHWLMEHSPILFTLLLQPTTLHNIPLHFTTHTQTCSTRHPDTRTHALSSQAADRGRIGLMGTPAIAFSAIASASAFMSS